MLTFVVLVWFKKVWDFVKPATQEADASMTIPPENRYLKALYDFSFDIMSNALWRTIIFLLVVIILVVVSLLHLVRNSSSNAVESNYINSLCSQVECGVEFSNDDKDSLLDHAFSACLHSWVRNSFVSWFNLTLVFL